MLRHTTESKGKLQRLVALCCLGPMVWAGSGRKYLYASVVISQYYVSMKSQNIIHHSQSKHGL